MADQLPLDPATRRRLVGALELLDSPQPGEAAAAASAASRLVRAKGLRWELLITTRPPKGDFGQKSDRDTSDRTDEPEPSSRTWQSDVAFCRRFTGWLRPWEVGFIESVGQQRRLSPKQLDTLRGIASALRARGAR